MFPLIRVGLLGRAGLFIGPAWVRTDPRLQDRLKRPARGPHVPTALPTSSFVLSIPRGRRRLLPCGHVWRE